MMRTLLLAGLAVLLASSPADAGERRPGEDPARGRGGSLRASPPDSAELRDRARDAQERFERVRWRNLPRVPDSGGRPCSEVIGRFCLIQGTEDWEPEPEAPEIVRGRESLLRTLAEIGEAIPGDRWVLSQRVLYLGEAGRWSEARELTRECGGQPETWWCHGLAGFVHHGAGRFAEALDAFRGALGRMEPERAERWNDPEQILEGGAFRAWNDADDGQRPRLFGRLWSLADPLYLVPGNDRLTAHYARHTLSWIRDDAANPYRISWGWDLERILIRYGAEHGWERQRPRATSLEAASVIGHHHPQSKQYLPSARAFEAPTELETGEWSLEEDRPRTAYAPSYAPRMAIRPFQLARFRREEELVLVAGFALPTDTAKEERPENARPGPWDGPVQAGLFLVDPDTGPVREVRLSGEERGVLRLRAARDAYLVSTEVWDPGRARAARSRQGTSLSTLPPDVAALSDLLLLDAGERPPRRLEEAVPRARAELRACAGERVTVGWELYGLGLVRESVDFRLRLRRTDRGFLRRAGEWLGILGDAPSVSLRWSEAGPDRPGPFFRAVDLTPPPDAGPGTYELALRVRLEGRTPLEARRSIRIGGAGCRRTGG